MKMKQTIAFTILSFLFSLTVICHAQVPGIQWQKTIGGNKDDELYSLQQTADGGYILGGSSNSGISGDKTVGTCDTNNFDYWIVKTDCGGNIQWQKDIGGGGGDDIVNSIRQTNDGGYIVGGYAQNTPGISCQKTLIGYGIGDWWVMKLDSAGNIQWQLDLGGGCNDYLNSVEQTADGGYILGGDSRSNANDGNKTVNMCGNANCEVLSDYWVVKLDSAGHIKWQRDYGATANNAGCPGDENLNAIHQTTDGGYILGGSSNGGISCSKTAFAFNASYDYWIVKIDSEGNIQWQQDIGGNDLDALNDIKQTADGGYIAGGTSNSGITGNKTSNNWNQSSDYYVVKLDSAGNIQWQRDIGGNNYDGLNSLAQTTDHGYILGGFSNSDSSFDKTVHPLTIGQYDYWLVKLDSTGSTIQWQLDIGRNDTQAVLFGVQQTTDGGYILGGVSNPSSANLSGKVNNVGNPYGEQFGGDGTHYWVVKLGSCATTYCGTPPQQRDSICFGNSVTLNGIIEYGGINWIAAPNGSPISSLSCTTCINPVAAPSLTTQYVEQSASNPSLYCSDTATVVIVPTVGNMHIDTNICFNNSVQLHISANDTTLQHNFTWSPALYLSNDTIANPVCAPLVDTDITYTVIITNNNAAHCTNVDTVSVTHLTKTSLLSPDTTICRGTTVQVPFTGNAAYSYNWTPGNWLSNAAIIDPLATPDSTITYKATVSYLGCKDSALYTINVTQPPGNINFAMSDSAICEGKPVLFQGNYSSGSVGIMWHFGDGVVDSNKNPVAHIYDTSGQMAVTLTATYSGLCPTVSFADTVTIYPKPVIQVPDTGMCPNDTITIHATGAASYHWLPDNRTYISDTSVADIQVSPQTNWDYVVYGASGFGCLDTATAHVRVFSNAVIQLPDSIVLYYGESYQFNPGTNCLSFNWFPPYGLNADNISNPIATPDVDTKYIVTGTTEEGCTIKDSVNVYRSDKVVLTLPNAFTPGNGPNSLLKPIHEGNITLDYLRIFNRWGQLIYESSDLNEGWDGTWHGTPQPAGVFIYTMEGHTSEGKQLNKQGNITLIR